MTLCWTELGMEVEIAHLAAEEKSSLKRIEATMPVGMTTLQEIPVQCKDVRTIGDGTGVMMRIKGGARKQKEIAPGQPGATK